MKEWQRKNKNLFLNSEKSRQDKIKNLKAQQSAEHKRQLNARICNSGFEKILALGKRAQNHD